MSKNYISIYRVTNNKGVVLSYAIARLLNLIFAHEKTILGWNVLKLVGHCSLKNYSLEKCLNVVCLDGHEDDPIELTEYKEPPGITQIKEERKRKEAKSKVKKRKA